MSTSVSKTRVTTALLVTIVSATSHAPVLHSSLDLDVKLVSGSVPIQYRYLSLPFVFVSLFLHFVVYSVETVTEAF